MKATKIEWTQRTVNPLRARLKGRPPGNTSGEGHYCEKIGSGCLNCYASRFQRRVGLPEFGAGQHLDEVELYLDEAALERVRARQTPTAFFWCDMTDLFGSWVKQEWIDAIFATIDDTPQHVHQVLTKRIVDARKLIPPTKGLRCVANLTALCGGDIASLDYRDNLWLGCSVSEQSDIETNLPALRQCRDIAAVLFVSAEPLVSRLDFRPHLKPMRCSCGSAASDPFGNVGAVCPHCGCELKPAVDQLILGGESGPKSRDCDLDHLRFAVAQARAADVPVFVKQAGRKLVHHRAMRPEKFAPHVQFQPDGRIVLKHPKGGDMTELPTYLRSRELPRHHSARVFESKGKP